MSKNVNRGVSYIVKPEARLVVCEIRENDGTRFRGTAKCNPTDEFKEEVGKIIAFSRACAKRKREYVKYCKACLREIERQKLWLEEKRHYFEKQIDKANVSIAMCKVAAEKACSK